MPNQYKAAGADFSYSTSKNAVHKRLRARKGKASQHDCVDCGKQAAQWSWVHDTDPTNYENYRPRCVSCHCRYDEFGFQPGHVKTPLGHTRWVNIPRNATGRFAS